MSTQNYKTEDEVRNIAKNILGLSDNECGQITTFNQLGFKGIKDKPDGWCLPKNKQEPALILETKASNIDINKSSCIEELLKNCKIVAKKYKNVVGILYNGNETIIYKNQERQEINIDLQNKEYYFNLFKTNNIDKQKIYLLTAKINNCLHFDFGIKNLYHRMIFTACALVAKRYGAILIEGMDYNTFQISIKSKLEKSFEKDLKLNSKLRILLEVYSEIRPNSTENQEAINNFIKWIDEISDNLNSDYWNGEDIMAIFFNEFNRYKKKSEHGQIFTPDNITSLMYRICGITKDDRVLDAACGSGAFLVKSMCNMIKEAGGINSKKAKTIKTSQLYGIEFDREIYALACANMLIHKDGKTNVEQLDSRSQEACDWIKSKEITKVLMNPPFETKYGCLDIVNNVLMNVPKQTICAFILPDKKLEKGYKDKKYYSKLLKHSTLKKIIKLPEKTFDAGVTTSIFIFESGIPHGEKEIFTCYIEDDGLETVKNQGRQDIKNRWQSIEDRWVEIINKQSGDNTIKWIKPSECLSYQMPEKEFEIYEEDFTKTVMDYLMFKQSINVKNFEEKLINKIIYNSEILSNNNVISINMRINEGDNEQN